MADSEINAPLKAMMAMYIGPEGIYFETIKDDEQHTLGEKYYYLQLAIQKKPQRFQAYLDRAYNPAEPIAQGSPQREFLNALKTVNDLCFDSTVQNSSYNYVSILEHFFKQYTQNFNPVELIANLRALLKARLVELKESASSVSEFERQYAKARVSLETRPANAAWQLMLACDEFETINQKYHALAVAHVAAGSHDLPARIEGRHHPKKTELQSYIAVALRNKDKNLIDRYHLLSRAVYFGLSEATMTFLALGASINQIDPYDGRTPLINAALAIDSPQKNKIFYTLLSHPATDIEVTNLLGQSVEQLPDLPAACRSILRLYRLAKTSPLAHTINQGFFLHGACQYNLFHEVQIFIDAGCDINLRTGTGETPLAIAAMYDADDVMALLYSRFKERLSLASLTPEQRVKFRNIKAREDIKSAITLAFKADTPALVIDEQGLLMQAINLRLLPEVTRCLNSGCDVRVENSAGPSPLELATRTTQQAIVEQLLNHPGILIDKQKLRPIIRDTIYQTMVEEAIQRQHHYEVLSRYIQRVPTLSDSEFSLALNAIQADVLDFDFGSKLGDWLALGGNINDTDEKGNSLLMRAITSDKPSLVAALFLKPSLDLTCQNSDGQSVFDVALTTKYEVLLSNYQQKRQDYQQMIVALNGPSEQISRQLFIKACHYGFVSMAKKLLQRRPRALNYQNAVGDNALLVVIKNQHRPLFEWLRKQPKINFFSKNHLDQSSLSLAKNTPLLWPLCRAIILQLEHRLDPLGDTGQALRLWMQDANDSESLKLKIRLAKAIQALISAPGNFAESLTRALTNEQSPLYRVITAIPQQPPAAAARRSRHRHFSADSFPAGQRFRPAAEEAVPDEHSSLGPYARRDC